MLYSGSYSPRLYNVVGTSLGVVLLVLLIVRCNIMRTFHCNVTLGSNLVLLAILENFVKSSNPVVTRRIWPDYRANRRV